MDYNSEMCFFSINNYIVFTRTSNCILKNKLVNPKKSVVNYKKNLTKEVLYTVVSLSYPDKTYHLLKMALCHKIHQNNNHNNNPKTVTFHLVFLSSNLLTSFISIFYLYGQILFSRNITNQLYKITGMSSFPNRTNSAVPQNASICP